MKKYFLHAGALYAVVVLQIGMLVAMSPGMALAVVATPLDDILTSTSTASSTTTTDTTSTFTSTATTTATTTVDVGATTTATTTSTTTVDVSATTTATTTATSTATTSPPTTSTSSATSTATTTEATTTATTTIDTDNNSSGGGGGGSRRSSGNNNSLECSASRTTIALGESVTFTASGGDRPYTFNLPTGFIRTGSTSATVTGVFTSVALNSAVTVEDDDDDTATCPRPQRPGQVLGAASSNTTIPSGMPNTGGGGSPLPLLGAFLSVLSVCFIVRSILLKRAAATMSA